MSKKLKQKLKNQHIEIENLQSKLTYTIRLRTLIDDCTTTQDINLLFPSSKQTKTNKKDKLQLFQTFYIDGFKIILGKNEKENIAVLKSAKSNNMWFHLKDISSSHIVVVSQKEKLPQHIIEYAAKLCVSFSCDQKGTYIVDYTQRKYVRIQRKANTIYTHNKSISVKF
jgi:predicted ribosome quality control (RQC) complex YloA/Tae2 family protein